MNSIQALYDIYSKHPEVCTDTRKLQPGQLFFALKGPNFNGNKFAQKAIEQGAAYAIIDEAEYQFSDRCILVENVLVTLQELANYHRHQFDIPIVAIGGSNGKTTTKELISAVLSNHYPCHFTRGNLNNHIGVPLTLLAMQKNTEVAIIEMGVNQIGDMAELCQLAEPTHGLLTNIGKEHLEGFGDIEGVKKAEGELFEYLNSRENGWIFNNDSDPVLKSMAQPYQRVILYAQVDVLEPGSPIIAVRLDGLDPTVSCSFLDENEEEFSVTTNLVGRHNFNNVAAAIALGIYFKVPGSRIKSAIEGYTPQNNRSQIIRSGEHTYLLDAYNANPSSMEAAMQTIKEMSSPRKVLILGDMLELGAVSESEHRSILLKAIEMQPDDLALVGNEFMMLKEEFPDYCFFENTEDARSWFVKLDPSPSLILLKGSRGIGLEKILYP